MLWLQDVYGADDSHQWSSQWIDATVAEVSDVSVRTGGPRELVDLLLEESHVHR